ncbi:MAG: flotillin family protein [Haliscomenobacteraceae bacterium CHB4]|nr:Inner membrane protein YqiK [Saprospiraceae bacterium]MCE7922624.1 flotillin family protein [Haliscomenobacteraceae bacterium CHB4]
MAPVILLIVFLLVFLFIIGGVFISRYKRCPSDRILVIFGKTGSGQSAKCIHGGAAFVWPVIQDYSFLDLTPISIDVDLRNALSKQNIRVDVPSRFTVGISTEPAVMTNAAERLLGLDMGAIRTVAHDIIVGQMRLVIATMDIEEINADRDKFYSNVSHHVESELKKVGLRLINVNVTDIHDESGYIVALGKEAAAKAINDARVSVAQKTRDGSIGEADAQREMRIKVSETQALAQIGEAEALQMQRAKVANAEAIASSGEAEAQQLQRIRVAEANARAVEGENQSRIAVAKSEAERRQAEAESLRQATTAEKVQSAKALEDAYKAEEAAELARAAREKASREADEVVRAEIEKRKAEIAAEAQAEQIRRVAKGEADAIFLKQEAEARGLFEVLSKQAEGFQKVVESAGGNTREAVLLLIADKLPELVKIQVEAIKGIKIDKVTVWEGGGNGANGDGNSTSNFISGMYRAVPPLNDLLNMAGMELPEYLGKKQEEANGEETKKK